MVFLIEHLIDLRAKLLFMGDKVEDYYRRAEDNNILILYALITIL